MSGLIAVTGPAAYHRISDPEIIDQNFF